MRIAVSLGVPLAQAVAAASAVCAKALDMEDKIGAISPGAYADMVLLDSELRVKKVYMGGEKIVL